MPYVMPEPSTFQSAGTSKAVPYFGLTTTFQPGITGATSPPARGLPVGGAGAGAEGELAAGFGSATSFLLSSLVRTKAPVTAAATTTAEAATMATVFVAKGLEPPPPCGGCGGCPGWDGVWPHG